LVSFPASRQVFRCGYKHPISFAFQPNRRPQLDYAELIPP
jgi:hypothetical protein